jgi:hypothetical protein
MCPGDNGEQELLAFGGKPESDGAVIRRKGSRFAAAFVRDGGPAADVLAELERPSTAERKVVARRGHRRVEAERPAAALGMEGLRHHEEDHLRLRRQHWG